MQQSMENWIDRLGDNPIPVMQHTIENLARLCDADVPIHELVGLVETDPGLTVQVVRTCTTSSHSSMRAEVTSVQQALMMMGVEKLKRLPATLPTVEKKLKGPAQQHVLKTFSIAYHAARQSTAWAKARRDMLPDEVTAATLLHFLGEMVLSIYAPELLDKIYKMRTEDHIASEEAQYIVLGFTLDQLSLEIANRWNLPPLVKDALHAENARYPRAYSIMLAVQLARHAAFDWYSPKMNILYKETAEWLDKPMSVLIRETHKLAVAAARDSEFYNVIPSAALLLSTKIETGEQTNTGTQTTSQSSTGICLIPQRAVMQETVNKLKALPDKTKDLHEVIDIAMQGLHDGIGLNRVVFAIYDKTKNILKAYTIAGADNNPVFGQFYVDMDKKNIFTYMTTKVQAVWINDTTREKYGPLIPEALTKITSSENFFSMSVVLNNKLFGLFYADRHTSDCHLDQNSYGYFKAICMQTIQAMQRMPGLHP